MTITQLKYIIAVASSSSMNEAAKKLFISQPSLSASIKDLESEIGFDIYTRSNRGVALTSKGKEFIGYARQVVMQYELMENKYINGGEQKKHFSVSSQHYAFAVDAFAKMVQLFGMAEYEFAFYETKTYEVIQDVKNFKSEIGILYVNEFNRKVFKKLFSDFDLEFHPIVDCDAYVYMWKEHPLAHKTMVSMEELVDYPCLSFEQGDNNSFYFSEEMISTYQYKQLIKISDRATGLNLMKGLQGYTICSGILCEELNGDDFTAVKLKENERMTVGYVLRKNLKVSKLAEIYLEKIQEYISKREIQKMG
ncbi:MAG: LysR family transcriptional regulator [Lachnospiraceae bacterium]|nr:LysR family transcriptional regulator [Lachnospiraceae bacterium]